MFDKPYYQRLREWKHFRDQIEISETPFEDALDFWSNAPVGRPCTDPYDNQSWPTPWEMIQENTYCEFLRILGICYTFQLTERFSESQFEIHITLDRKQEYIVYLLFVDNQPIGYYNDERIDESELSNFVSQMRHTMIAHRQ